MKERKGSRLKTRALVRAEYEGTEYALENLSETGAFIRTASPLAVGKEMELRLVGKRLPDPIELTAVVRHRKPVWGWAWSLHACRTQGRPG